jgi:hypothetical protein
LSHGLAGSANADFSFVIASQGEMADAMGISVERTELPQQAHSILWWRWLTIQPIRVLSGLEDNQGDTSNFHKYSLL